MITKNLFKAVKDVIIGTSPNVLIGSLGKVEVSEALDSGVKDFETRGLHLSYIPMFLHVLKRFG